MEDPDVGTAHLRDGVELLIGGHDGDYVVTGAAEGRKHQVVGTGGAVGGDDVPGPDGLVEIADPVEECGEALDVAVGQATFGERVQEFIAGRTARALGAVAIADVKELVEGH